MFLHSFDLGMYCKKKRKRKRIAAGLSVIKPQMKTNIFTAKNEVKKKNVVGNTK